MSIATAEPAVHARLGTWPHDPRVAHLVLSDHRMVPNIDDVAGWVRTASERGSQQLRTGALFPEAATAFVDSGFRTIDSLVLLECEVARSRPVVSRKSHRWHARAKSPYRVRRLRGIDVEAAAELDGRSFEHPWSNSREALDEICDATPHHRARAIVENESMLAFVISGRTSSCGYVQRLAVDTDARRKGLGAILLDDALAWMHRRGVSQAMVNTNSDNAAAIALYRSAGFALRPEVLTILELRLNRP